MDLRVPIVPNAIDGKLGYFEIRNGVQVEVPVYEDVARGDLITIFWGDEYSIGRLIDSIADDLPMIFNVSDYFPLSCLYDGVHIVRYTITDSNGNTNESDPLSITISTSC